MFKRSDVKDNYQFIHDLHFDKLTPVGEIKRMFVGACYDDIKNVILSFGKFPITESEIKYQKFKSKLTIDILKDLHFVKYNSVSSICRMYRVQDKYLKRLFNEYNLVPLKDLSPATIRGIKQVSKLSVDAIKKANATIINHSELANYFGVSETILRQYCKDNNLTLTLKSNRANNILATTGVDAIKTMLENMSVTDAAIKLDCSECALRRFMTDNKIVCTYRMPTIINRIQHYDEIYDMYYNKNMDTYSIAEFYSVSQFTIHKFIVDNGMPRQIRKPAPVEYDLAGLKELYYEKFYTLIELATHFNVSYAAIERYMKANNLKTMVRNTERMYFTKKAEIINDYTVNKLSLVAMNKKYNIHADVLSRYLKRDGIKIEHRAMISAHHVEIMEYLDSIGIEFEVNDRIIIHPYEIDILIPSLKIGIEYHGLYYHSTARTTDYTYHNRKSNLATAAGYRLIQIFADEWSNNRSVVEYKLKEILIGNLNTVLVDYTVEVISKEICTEFYNNSNFTNTTAGSFNYGIFELGNLVSVMSVNVKHCIVEVVNFSCHYSTECFKILIDNIISNHLPVQIIGEVDLCWESSTSNEYLKYGFTKVGEYVDYSYTSNYTSRIPRQIAVSNLSGSFDATLDEKTNMENSKHFRVFDAGHLVYSLQI